MTTTMRQLSSYTVRAVMGKSNDNIDYDDEKATELAFDGLAHHTNNSTTQRNMSDDDDASKSSNSRTSSSAGQQHLLNWSTSMPVIVTFIMCFGLLVAGGLLYVGMDAARDEEELQFDRVSQDLVQKIESKFYDYVNAASLIHNRCRHRNFTRQDFRELYEYLVSGGLEFKAIQFDPNVTHEEREIYEASARAYYKEHYPHIEYRGFVGFETDPPTTLEPRSVHDFYFPIHYMEPIIGNEAAIDLDYNSHVSRHQTLDYAMQHGQPALTDRLTLVKDPNAVSRCGGEGPSYGVVLMHPGVNLTTSSDVWPRDLSSIVICIPDLLRLSVRSQEAGLRVNIYDSSDTSGETLFLGGIEVNKHDSLHHDLVDIEHDFAVDYLEETALEEHDLDGRFSLVHNLQVTNKHWTIVVQAADEEEYKPSIAFVVIGAVIILGASACLAIWVVTNAKRSAQYNQMKSQAESEKASLVLENSRQAARAERELNDFIAHEVRNPVSAAMSACSFVRTAVYKDKPLQDEETIQCTREDIDVIDNSLKFVNDLLRNMLDMHRASNKQLQVSFSPADMLHDILEPVGGMLYQRGSKVDVQVECPNHLTAMVDVLRLKQVLLNLGRNSCKFIQEGFIRLRAEVIEGIIHLSVEDSGSGIPTEKRERLFSKFQESLDVLSQGTGIGLFLCNNLVDLMGGKIYLDNDYDSGIPGHPGTKFVIRLNVQPLESCYNDDDDDDDLQKQQQDGTSTTSETGEMSTTVTSNNTMRDIHGGDDQEMDGDEDAAAPVAKSPLPEEISVLFVDDDAILRKLFHRVLKTVAPSWSIREAANGESALRLVEKDKFDLIFMDMYMASVEKQLLGTETVAAMRSMGVTSRICGLSANDMEEEFVEAGADAFAVKPFPCERNELIKELRRVLYGSPDGLFGSSSSPDGSFCDPNDDRRVRFEP